jgi:hypothetical protein
MGELYKLDFPNGKAYVGQTEKTSEIRFNGHKNAFRLGAKTALYNAWRKYGEPKLTTLAIVEDFDLDETEIRAIAVLNTLAPNGYNTTKGGDRNPMELKANRLKVSRSKRGSKNPMKVEKNKKKRDEKRNAWLKTPEAKSQISARTKAAIEANPELIEINRRSQIEVWKREGHKEKMSEKAKAAWSKRKAEGRGGMNLSEEELKARSERAKAQWASGNIGRKGNKNV